MRIVDRRRSGCHRGQLDHHTHSVSGTEMWERKGEVKVSARRQNGKMSWVCRNQGPSVQQMRGGSWLKGREGCRNSIRGEGRVEGFFIIAAKISLKRAQGVFK